MVFNGVIQYSLGRPRMAQNGPKWARVAQVETKDATGGKHKSIQDLLRQIGVSSQPMRQTRP